MFKNTAFSERDWELAPHYTSPTHDEGVIILDFGILTELAERERDAKSFRLDALGRLSSAPLYVDDLPAAFYQVHTSFPETTSNINTSGHETLVVVDGVLKVIFNDKVGDYDEGNMSSLQGTLYQGEVMELEERAISLQAIGLLDPAQCLALALYRDRDIQVMTI